ncbi:L,D-transpeptidase family protein [uncultured Peptoniphilus sp.]|uniref:L,D-transpeptidase family protein n=1 Tax=uncultured Peptoniphilus sp. TaxID=254354 RepID=UPI002803FBAD|nr:L,D-transpeptidase family protein [uncultured Peptoniphilus sp.]
MRKTFKFILIFILLLFIVVYFIGAYFFSTYFLPKTFINGKDFSLQKKDDLYKTYNGIWDDYEITLKGREGEDKLKVSDFSYKDELLPNQDLYQPSIYWFLSSLYKKEYELKHRAIYSIEDFDRTVNNLDIVKNQNQKPEDAKVIYEDGKFSIKEEILGNTLKERDLKESILRHLREENKIIDLEEEKIYLEPSLKSDDSDLQKLLDEYKTLDKITISFNFEDRKEVLDHQKLINLYKRENNRDLVPSEEKVVAYVNNLSVKYDTFGGKRIFPATGIGNVLVTGGIYGWSTDIKKTSELLLNALSERKNKELVPVYRTTALHRSENDLGNSYIEIDLARQNVWLYKDGNLVLETKVVTGNPNNENATPTGTQKIWSRERDRFLTGADYKSFVNYWLPINWKGIGLHDAPWRSEFGEDLYLKKGSHGCINVPPEIMPKLYENTFNGMPVIVYDSNSQKIS